MIQVGRERGLRCEGILVRALIDWPRLLVGKSKAASFSDFIESVSNSSSQPDMVNSCVGLAVPIVPSLAYGSDFSSIQQFQLCKVPTPCYGV